MYTIYEKQRMRIEQQEPKENLMSKSVIAGKAYKKIVDALPIMRTDDDLDYVGDVLAIMVAMHEKERKLWEKKRKKARKKAGKSAYANSVSV